MRKLIKTMSMFVIISLCVFLASCKDTTSTRAFRALDTQIVTFAWEQPNMEFVQEWELFWSDKAPDLNEPDSYASFEKVVSIIYDGTDTGSFQSPVETVVYGPSASWVPKWFTLRACGDVPQDDGTILRQYSVMSNTVSHDFWIPFYGFEAPVEFKIVPSSG